MKMIEEIEITEAERQELREKKELLKPQWFEVCSGEVPPEGCLYMSKQDAEIIQKNLNDLSKRILEEEEGVTFYPPPPEVQDPLIKWRLEALKIAKDISLNLGHFKDTYESKEEFFEELDYMYETSGKILEYLLGEK